MKGTKKEKQNRAKEEIQCISYKEKIRVFKESYKKFFFQTIMSRCVIMPIA